MATNATVNDVDVSELNKMERKYSTLAHAGKNVIFDSDVEFMGPLFVGEK